MYPSLIFVTEVPGDVFGRLGDVTVFCVAIPTYVVARSCRCSEVLDNIADNVVETCVEVLGCLSLFVVVLAVDMFVVALRDFRDVQRWSLNLR